MADDDKNKDTADTDEGGDQHYETRDPKTDPKVGVNPNDSRPDGPDAPEAPDPDLKVEQDPDTFLEDDGNIMNVPEEKRD